MEADFYKRKIITTEDGSQTLFIPEMDENYHSSHGAIQESMHVFINAGLSLFTHKKKVSIFEAGFGTGLNALLTYQYAQKNSMQLYYEAVEKYPLSDEEYLQLNFAQQIDPNLQQVFLKMHETAWEKSEIVTPNFELLKTTNDLANHKLDEKFDLIFFDAFAPDKQPNLWIFEVFQTMYKGLTPGGVLVTYAAKGQVRRNMQQVGFAVERLSGPPGKREMLRATK